MTEEQNIRKAAEECAKRCQAVGKPMDREIMQSIQNEYNVSHMELVREFLTHPFVYFCVGGNND